MNVEGSRNTVFLSAFLHDIGKALQRGDSNLMWSHSQVGSLFLHDELLRNYISDIGLLKTLVLSHHERFTSAENSIENQKREYQPLCYLVSRADNYSSQERGEKGSFQKGWENTKKTPMQSVFQDLELHQSGNNKEERYFPFSRFSLDKNDFFPNKETTGSIKDIITNPDTGLEVVWNALTQQMSNKEFSQFFNAVYLIAYHYLWCIPANTQEEHPTISLFDHLKTTAAIALCSYDYHESKGELEDIASITNDETKKFRLLVADFSGIQNYIYDLASHTYAAKRLRARSFFVEMLLEEVKQMILTEFSLYPTNVVFQSGGKFYILLPATETVQQKINSIKARVDRIAFKKFQAEISLNIGLSEPFSGKEFQSFSDIVFDTSKQLNQNKYCSFDTYLAENPHTIESHYEGFGVCPLCRKFAATEQKYETNMCKWCQQDINIGENLKKDGNHYIHFYSQSNAPNESFELFERYFSINHTLDDKAENVVVYNSYSQDIFQSIQAGIFAKPFDIRCFANHVPGKNEMQKALHETEFEKYNKDKDIDGDFQDIAQCAQGNKMLGVLKGDVDNLGQIFALGLERDNSEKSKNTPSRQATLSRTLDTFFAGYLNEFVKEKYPTCYIVYSGGDDFLVIGPWTETLELAKAFQKEFEEFTWNSDVTLSAGISFCKPKFPISKAIKKADEALEIAKHAGKNRLCAFDSVLEWQDLDMLWNEKEKLLEWGNKENAKISVQFIRHLLHYAEMMQKYKEEKDPSYLRWQPMLAYQIARNFWGKHNTLEKQWIDKILNNQSDMRDGDQLKFVASYVLYLLRN